jgi:hypothetical protein
MRSGLVPSNIINMETNRVSQLDETGSGLLNNMPTKSRYPPIQKEKGLGMSGFWLIETKLLKS